MTTQDNNPVGEAPRTLGLLMASAREQDIEVRR